jgi:hypothetical protein
MPRISVDRILSANEGELGYYFRQRLPKVGLISGARFHDRKISRCIFFLESEIHARL